MIMETDMTEAEVAQPELTLAKIAADIVVAFVSRNVLGADDLPKLTMQIRAALVAPTEIVAAPMVSSEVFGAHAPHDDAHGHDHVHVAVFPPLVKTKAKAQKPAVPVSKSVTPDYIVCLEDGKSFRSLKRHLKSEHGMSAEEYREKWNLPQHYELVAPNYSAVRTELAKKHGLGRNARPLTEDESPKIAAE